MTKLTSYMHIRVARQSPYRGQRCRRKWAAKGRRAQGQKQFKLKEAPLQGNKSIVKVRQKYIIKTPNRDAKPNKLQTHQNNHPSKCYQKRQQQATAWHKAPTPKPKPKERATESEWTSTNILEVSGSWIRSATGAESYQKSKCSRTTRKPERRWKENAGRG